MTEINGKNDFLDIKQRDAVNQLRDLVLADNFVNVRTDDRFFLRFLYSKDFDVQQSFQLMKDNYMLKFDHPDWFASSGPKSGDHDYLLSCKCRYILDGRDRQGRRILLMNFDHIDPEKTSVPKVAQLDDICFEAVYDEPETQQAGLAIVADVTYFNWGFFKWVIPSNVRVSSKRMELLPFKAFHIHIVNTSMLMNAAIAIIYPFLSAKTKEHIHFHYSNWSSLHEFMSPDVLPPEYGGTKPLDFEKANKFFFEKDDVISRNVKITYQK